MKTKREIMKSAYVTQTDIRTLLNCSQGTAHRLYGIADRIDAEMLGEWRIEPRKVRLKSLLKVAGIDYSFLERMAKDEAD